MEYENDKAQGVLTYSKDEDELGKYNLQVTKNQMRHTNLDFKRQSDAQF